jgi:hypothetical protein
MFTPKPWEGDVQFVDVNALILIALRNTNAFENL